MEELLEIQKFLSVDARLDLKSVAVSDVLGKKMPHTSGEFAVDNAVPFISSPALSGSPESRCLINECPKLIHSLFCLTMDYDKVIAKEALLALVNVSADERGARMLIAEAPNLVQMSVRFILDEDSPLADAWAMLLSNCSRPEQLVETIVDDLLAKDDTLNQLVSAFTRIDYNKHKCHLNYLGPIFSNVSQTARVRAILCSADSDLLLRLLTFASHASTLRRGGVIGMLKNVCFDSARHAWLLNEVNVLPYLLLPLAGPEEFSDEDNDMFPVELQYLDADKERESDPDLRKILLESLAQLCATRAARDLLRKRGVYEILRELHKFECGKSGDRQALLACENVVDVLIRTEEEIGEDNLKELKIPDEIEEKFNKELE